MNFLAHLYLAGENEGLIVGNFIADSVKGNKFNEYEPSIAKGIQMHRAIDFFSDTHPIYRQTSHRLAPIYGKFSGVITDMFFDHFLAHNWSNYSSIDLAAFAENIYNILRKHQANMPEKSRIILTYMSSRNWLVSYVQIEGIRRALKGLSERMKYYSPMDEAVKELEKDYELYKNDFVDFFPLLQEHVKDFKS